MPRQVEETRDQRPETKDHKLKAGFFSFLSGIILALAFVNGKFWLLAWFGYVPLFIALKKKAKFQAFLLSYLAGIVFWAGTIYWLVHVTLPGTILLILYLALYFGIFGLILNTYDLRLTCLAGRRATYDLIFFSSVWVLLEYIRAHLFTGFPWALLGYSQYLNLPVIQIADITGAWGVSFLVIMVNIAIFSVVSRKSSVISIKQKYLLPLLILFATLAYGYFKIFHLPLTTYHLPLRVSVIQGNIPQELKWDPQAKDYIVNKYLDISRDALADKPDLIIWPEASLPVVLEEEPAFFEKIKSFAQEANTPLLLGAVTIKGGIYHNSALLVSGKGLFINKYDKLHLVPFGEYIPLRQVFPFLETIVPIGDIVAGKEYTVFQAPNEFSVLICFEDLFPELSRWFIKKGARFLVNITNDAWYKRTSAPYQHLQASVFRAVENRVYLARSANTGISGFILPSGKLSSLVCGKSGRPIFIDGHSTQEIDFSKKPLSFYTRHGDIFILACLLLVLYGIIRFQKTLSL